ncbi:DUF29 domain-containing protein [Kovacikia minuta CCNUW1]|uniref:DUF29 domain-containing protein n=1 Tax=Kovacikia minuta TaxID=2931930 RepID=UPI001CCF6AD3|nr:DUF29 domain-containing protein [Kovacikia minuta]UBF25867.1 DUF29 domain-containing protein [Kovacikia minuta CCNUW1]
MNVTDSSQKLAQLYEADFVLWIEKTVQLLKQGNLSELDIENLIEEIEALSRRDKREIQSRLIVLLQHLLKYTYQPERRSNSWIATINEQRLQIILILNDSPSLRNYLAENFAGCYARARKQAADETGLPIATFPETAPFAETDVLTEGWLP